MKISICFFLLCLEITIAEFIKFESLLLASDSLYRLAFQLFDRQGQGFITFDDFQYIISATKQFKEFPFNFESDFVQTHFGVKRQRQITYKEFTQILLGNKSSSIFIDLIFLF
jgi:solute carrier family 25 aspartate/glutamate transporter 12/13